MAALTQVSSRGQLEELAKSSSQQLVVIHFRASWAPQCQQVQEVLQEMATTKEMEPSLFVEVDAEKLADLSTEYGVTSVPTCVLVANGKPVATVEGADIPQLTKKVKEALFKHFPFSVGSIPSNASEKSDSNEKLKALVNRAPVMIFMKGSPDAPRCGFSRQLMELMREAKIAFDTFDILQDEQVRQELKVYSNWPTYPQIYVKGSLVGGLDIVKELKEMGELEQTFSVQ